MPRANVVQMDLTELMDVMGHLVMMVFRVNLGQME